MEEAAKGNSKLVIKASPKEYDESASDCLRNKQLIHIEVAQKTIPGVYRGGDQVITGLEVVCLN